MAVERSLGLKIPQLRLEQAQLMKNLDSEEVRNALHEMAELMQMYNGAMKSISTKLEVLDDEFQFKRKHNPIHHMECRLKPMGSIYEKMIRRGLTPSLETVRENILDIAGIRVVCNFLDDIYIVEKQLLRQHDITLIEKKDYIKNPKENGYRSLHLIVKIPVCLSDKTEQIPAEIQIRTIAMDYWASLEHKLRYKNNQGDAQKFSSMLLDCANTLAETEKTMQFIRESIDE